MIGLYHTTPPDIKDMIYDDDFVKRLGEYTRSWAERAKTDLRRGLDDLAALVNSVDRIGIDARVQAAVTEIKTIAEKKLSALQQPPYSMEAIKGAETTLGTVMRCMESIKEIVGGADGSTSAGVGR